MLLLVKYIDFSGNEIDGTYPGFIYSSLKKCNFYYLCDSGEGFFQLIKLLELPKEIAAVKLGFCSFYTTLSQEVFINQNIFYEKVIKFKNKPTISILGGCVTRDLFNLDQLKNKYDLVNYFARSSIASVVSKPFMSINKDSIKLSSKFQREMVYADLSKSNFDCIVQNQYDFLFIDFIDERFDLFVNDKTVLTCSSEFIDAKLSKELSDFHLLNFRESMELKLKSVAIFMEEMAKLNILDKIILHEIYWAEKYLNATGEICYFNEQMRSNIWRNNSFLHKIYSIVKQYDVKGVKSQFNLADENHMWGLTPYHFCAIYYKDIACQIDRLINIEKW